MTTLKSFKPLLLFIFTVLCACTASKSNEPPVNTAVSNLTEEAANCEEKMRGHISKHSLPFQVVKRFETEQNELLKQVKAPTVSMLSVEDRSGQILEYTHEASYSESKLNVTRGSRIGLNEKGSANPLYFENRIKVVRFNESVQMLTQRYILNTTDKDCIPELSKTSLSIVNKLSATSYQYKETSISYSGEVISEAEKVFSLKEHQRLADFILESTSGTYEEALKLKDIFAYFPGFGVVEFVISADREFEELAFNKYFKFRMVKIRVLSQEKEIFSTVTGEDTAEKVSITLQQNQKTWNLPFDKYFDKVFLGQAPISTSNAISKLDSDYQVGNNSVMLTTKSKIEFETFGAYWSTTKWEAVPEGFLYQLKENYLPVIDSKTQDLDLVSNSTIQTRLPEIQSIALNIQNSTSERGKQIQMILDYLALNYSYDYEMLNKGVIRPLTTKEALDRKKGVCQHYAVIFAAIARALKIPTRIIVGFLINGENVGMHAWVEVEISANRWQVIEPQSQKGLTQTLTRFYFPLSRATNLEDKDAAYPEKFVDSIMNNKFEFSKVDSK